MVPFSAPARRSVATTRRYAALTAVSRLPVSRTSRGILDLETRTGCEICIFETPDLEVIWRMVAPALPGARRHERRR